MTDEAVLVAAIMRRDVDAALAQLEIMKWTSERWARAHREGRRAAFPPAPLPLLADRFVLPVPGHLPGSTLSKPIVSEQHG